MGTREENDQPWKMDPRETLPLNPFEAASQEREKFDLLIRNMPEPVANMVVRYTPSGEPSDLVFLVVNEPFMLASGLSGAGLKADQIKLRQASYLLPGFGEEVPYGTEGKSWLELYANVVKTGIPERKLVYSEVWGRWYRVVAFRQGQDEVVSVFNDMTEMVHQAEELRIYGEYASLIAHEIKNPLAAISLKMQLMEMLIKRNDWDEELMLRMVGETKSIAGELSAMVDTIRSYELIVTAFDLTKALSDYLVMDQHRIETKRIDFSVEIADDERLKTVQADRVLVLVAMKTVLSNAINYVPGLGSGWIKIRVGVVDNEGGEWVRISVMDNGPGISQEELELIFEEDVRGVAGIEMDPHGTGKGLPFARRVMEQHGGVVRVKSQQGEGSEFSLIWPRVSRMRGLKRR